MSIVDFGKNGYHYEVVFRFDCLSEERIGGLVQSLPTVIGGNVTVRKGDPPHSVTLTRGSGTEGDPYYELKLGAGILSAWGGWHVPFDTWRAWRSNVIRAAVAALAGIPSGFVATLQSHTFCSIPNDRLLAINGVEEFGPIREFHERFLPRGEFSPVVAAATLLDPTGKHGVEWAIAPNNAVAGETLVALTLRHHEVDQTIGLLGSVDAHAARADTIAESFSEGIIKSLIRD
jgi:hypothetical protein